MKIQLRIPPRHSVAFLAGACAAMLSACGGSGSSTLEAATTTFTGSVSNVPAGTAVTATVTTSTTPATATTTNGTYTLSTPTGTINTGGTVVVTVTAPGYKSCSVTYGAGQLASNGGTVTDTSQCTTLAKADSGQVVPADGATLTRIGDGVVQAPDPINSQLQTTTGSAGSKVTAVSSKTVSFGAPASVAGSPYTRVTVSLKVRGLDASYCKDTLTISQGAQTWVWGSVIDTTKTAGLVLVDSDPTGAFSTYSFPIPTTATLSATDPVTVMLKAGDCPGKSTTADPLDDFEVQEITAQFTN